MPPVSTSRLTAAQRREQLLDVTKSIVGTRGFHAVSIEAVAREAGITRPIVYGHFGDLTGLLEALVQRESVRALTQLAGVVPADLGAQPREDLLAAFRAYLEAVAADPDTWRLVLMPPEGAPAVLRDAIAIGRAAIVSQMAAAVSAGADSPDPELTARTFSAFADESARLVLTDPAAYTAERMMTHARWLLQKFPV
jgi:AcrR family transcriptional regulator